MPNSPTRRVRVRTAALVLGLGVALGACGAPANEPGTVETSADDTVGTAGEATMMSADPGNDLPEGCAPPPPVPAAVPEVEPLPQDPASGRYDVTLETTCGDIRLELDADAAPVTVRSFQHLADSGFWDDSPCHRLTTDFIWVLQCGDPTGTGRGSPGYSFGIENAPADGQYPRGTLAMARAEDPDSNGSQFFVVYEDTELPGQTGGYSRFGRVVDGMQIIDTIASSGVGNGGADGPPAVPISILSVTVEP